LCSFAIHFPLLAVQSFHLLSLLASSPVLSGPFLSYLHPHPDLFFHLLHSLPLSLSPPSSSSSSSLPSLPLLRQRRHLLTAIAHQLYRSPTPSLIARLTSREADGSFYLLSLLSSLQSPIPPPPTLPPYIGSLALSSCLQLVDGRSSYDLPALYLALTSRAALPPPEAGDLCNKARQWNAASEVVAAVVEAGEAWAALVALLGPEWGSAGVAAVVESVLRVLVSEESASLALAAPLSSVLLAVVPHADGAEMGRGVGGQLMGALVNHQQPGTRCNLYALLLLYLHRGRGGQAGEELVEAVVGQGGRVMTLLVSDAVEGGLVMRAVACALLSHVVAASPASPAIPLLRQSALLPTALTQLVKRDEELRLCVLSPRPAYLPALHHFLSLLTLCQQLAVTAAGRELLIDADAVGQLGRLTVVDVAVERDLRASSPTGPPRYYAVLCPLLRLFAGLLLARHASVLGGVLGWLRGHQELITAVVKGGRGGEGGDEGLALQLMAQLLERVEAAGRALNSGHRPSTRGDELMAQQLARAQDSVTVNGGGGGVTGHLRGLLKFVGVALPAPAPVQAAPAGRVAARVAGVGVEEEAELDRGFLAKYDRRLLLHLQGVSQLPVAREDDMGDGAGGDGPEETVRAVLSLCCMRVEYGRGKELLFEPSLAAAPTQAGAFDPTPHLGTLVDVVEGTLRRMQEGGGVAEVEGEEVEAEGRRVQVVEMGLLLLLYHVQVYEERGGGRRGREGEGWKEEARRRLLPVLERADLVAGDKAAGGANGGSSREDGNGSQSTALIVAEQGGSRKRAGRPGPHSLFVSAFTRRLRVLLL
jgi:hypothetical protein